QPIRPRRDGRIQCAPVRAARGRAFPDQAPHRNPDSLPALDESHADLHASNMSAAEVAFWTSLGVVTYALIIYPLIAGLLAIGFRLPATRSFDFMPHVSFLIAAYNEAAVIRTKIEQTLALDYPPDLREIIVASDGSTDGTDEIVRSFADRGVRLYRSSARLGKTHAVNGAVATAKGDIIIFSDATGVFGANAIRELVSHFSDPT